MLILCSNNYLNIGKFRNAIMNMHKNRKNLIIFLNVSMLYCHFRLWVDFSLVVNLICVNMFFICHFKRIKFSLKRNLIWENVLVWKHVRCVAMWFLRGLLQVKLTGIWIFNDIFLTIFQAFLLKFRLTWFQIYFLAVLTFWMYFNKEH